MEIVLDPFQNSPELLEGFLIGRLICAVSRLHHLPGLPTQLEQAHRLDGELAVNAPIVLRQKLFDRLTGGEDFFVSPADLRQLPGRIAELGAGPVHHRNPRCPPVRIRTGVDQNVLRQEIAV